ncbi:putative Exopolysaccharide biosynthesis related tyrosine-protein kinase [Nitrospira japonica]|uniref:Putative Exopolysaccharide biosynthesis related tyrosine-protein kinase n=1 Tax=Nitrospira japonica TaxID=1325564 RepID=A0A1W1I9Q9_9BACT|nr:CpsD/CapB family tyrosine-protein kinase [Nitrospira japonica]SLM49609.1 putative Exopolysaccharide biosynthesis related tyrosine-protein kinase [Nitrospira japonica]
MDRLRAAVQLFKDRGKHSASPRSTGRNNDQSEFEPIVYTRTRSLDVPTPVLRRQRVMAAYGKGPYVDAYKILRTQILQRLRQHDWNVLGVTSPGYGEGKTLVAANLAVSLAMEMTQTVLLVDSNLQGPGIHEVFGMGACRGLADYLLDNEPVEDLLVHPDMGRLVVLPAGRAIPNSAEVLISPKMLALVEEFKHRYPSRVVIFDLPPLLHTADVLAFSPYTDALLLVVEEGKTTVEELQRALLLVKDRRPVLGTVINKAGRSDLSPAGMRKLLTH